MVAPQINIEAKWSMLFYEEIYEATFIWLSQLKQEYLCPPNLN